MTTMIETSEPMSPETEALLRRVEELERTVGALRETAEREATVREPAVVEARVAEPLSASDLAAVEERLEERVLERLSTRDSAELEERLVERLAARVPAAMPAPVTASFAPATPSPGTRWYDRVNPFKPRAIVPPPVSSGWLVWDMLSEARFLGSMIFDSRFGMAWTSRIVLVCCFSAFFLLEILLAPITYPISLVPIVGSFIGFCLIKLMTLFIAFFIFKVLARETARYRAYLAMLDAA
jgi:hypothetical protein